MLTSDNEEVLPVKNVGNIISRIPKIDTQAVMALAIFYFLAANYLVYAFLDLPGMKYIIRIGMMAVFAVYCLFRIIKKRVDLRFFVMIGASAVFLLRGSSISMNISFLLLMMIVLMDMDMGKLYNGAFKANMIMLVVVLLCLLLGLVENVFYVSTDGRSRNTLGFVNVNAASVFVYSLLCTYILSHPEKRYLTAPKVLIAMASVFLMTDSRTAFLCTIFLFVVWLLLAVLPRGLGRLVCAVFVIAMFLTPMLWCIPGISDGPINTLFSARPILFLRYMQEHEIVHLLIGGSTVEEVDNYYLIQLFGCGVVVYAVIAVIVMVAVDAMIKRKRCSDVAFCLSLLLYGQFEGTLIRPEIICVPVFWLLIFKSFSLKELGCMLADFWSGLKRAAYVPARLIRKLSQ